MPPPDFFHYYFSSAFSFPVLCIRFFCLFLSDNNDKLSLYYVKPKKYLGQHFLNDDNIAQKIVVSLKDNSRVLEIGPGTGVLTKHLIQIPKIQYKAVEVDRESVEYLLLHFSELHGNIIQADFLKMDLDGLFNGAFSIIGNFPYNISSQILFKVLTYKNQINEVVGMFQNEVAVRIASKPGKKDYGILSVLMQAFYDIEYLFTVDAKVFIPPPKVKSAVIRFVRNKTLRLACDEKLFFSIVKSGFNQRRKMLRNALHAYQFKECDEVALLMTKRAEQLSVEDFVMLTGNVISSQ